MRYTHQNLILIINNTTGKLYEGEKLVFKGNSYVGIQMMCDKSGKHPKVLEMFRPQLTQREKPKFSRSEAKKETREQIMERMKQEGIEEFRKKQQPSGKKINNRLVR